MPKRLAIAGSLSIVLLIAVCLIAPALSEAKPHPKALRFRVIKHKSHASVVRRGHRVLTVRDHHRYVIVHGKRGYRVVGRHRSFVLLANLAAAPATLAGSPVSVGKTSWASSVAAGDPATYGNDSLTATFWTAGNATYPQWWTVDLGAPTTVYGVKAAWNGGRRSFRYCIQTSLDGVSFTTAVDRSRNVTRGTTTDRMNTSARFVRVQVVGVSPSGAPASVSEITVNGQLPLTPTPTPTPTAPVTPDPEPTTSPYDIPVSTRPLNLTPPDGYQFNGGGTYSTSGTLKLRNNCKVIGVNFTGSGRQVVIHGNGNVVHGCTFSPNDWTALMIEVGNDNVIDDNVFNTTTAHGSNIQVTGGSGNHITNNVTKGGITAIAFTWSRDLSGAGPESVIARNIVSGNVCSGYSEEGITFDCHGDVPDDVPTFEYATVSAVNGNAVTFGSLAFPNYVGFYACFVDGAMRGRVRQITAESGSVFNLAGTLTGVKAGDHVTIGAPFLENVVGGNTVTSGAGSDPFSAIILYGLAYGNRIEGNTIPVGKIKVQSINGCAKATGQVTGQVGRAPCCYNTVRNNIIQASTGKVALQYWDIGSTGTPFVSEGNNVIGNQTPRVESDNQYAYFSGNTGTESLSATTKAAAEFVYDGE